MEPRNFLLDAGHRASTITARYQAVEMAILVMRERLEETLSLGELAEVASLSRCHFTRVFHLITGIPPFDFLAALRLEEAKRLLLTTERSITSVCFDVGYNSLGTFTRRFTQFVGLPPSSLRLLAEQITLPSLEMLHSCLAEQERISPLETCVSGHISVPDAFQGLIFVGLFPTPVPQGRPVGCSILGAQGTYRIAAVPDGHYYLFSAAIAWSDDPMEYLLPSSVLRGGVSQKQLVVCNGKVSGPRNIRLRPARLTDPPILISLPFMLAERMSSEPAAVALAR